MASARELSEAATELNELQDKHRVLIRELDRAGIIYAKQLEQREQYRLLPKGRMAPDGSRRYLVPDTSKVLLATPQRFTGKTVTIEADIMADNNPGGLKHEQHLVYGTPLWLHTWERLAAVLQNERIARGLTRGRLAELAGVSEALIVNLESGSHSDDREATLRIFAAFDIAALALPIPLDDQAQERAQQWNLLKRAEVLDPPIGRYLRPRPSLPDGTRVVVALDIDGVLNRLPSLFGPPRPDRPTVTGPHGEQLPIDVSMELVRTLDEQVRRLGCRWDG